MNDLRFAFRQLLKNPGFTAVVVLTLALGIGANTAIYSVVNTVLLNPIPAHEPDRLFQIGERTHGNKDEPRFGGLTARSLDILRTNEQLFTDVIWHHGLHLESQTEDFINFIGGAAVSPNFFKPWNIKPLLGRTFAKDETVRCLDYKTLERDTVVVLSYGFWQSHFGGDRHVLGKTIRANGRQFTVIGVMPRHFQFPGPSTTCWVPVQNADPKEDLPNIRMFVRLNEKVTVEQTQAMLALLAGQLVAEYPAIYDTEWRRRGGGFGFLTRPLRDEFTQVNYGAAQLQATLFGLLAAIGFVLLIACVNVGNLMLARTEKRQHEFAIRAAIGAGRVRLVRQLFTESIVLAGLGALAGLAITALGMKVLVLLIPETIPRLRLIQIDGHALAFTALVCIGVALAFGFIPAWHAARTSVTQALQRAGTGLTLSLGWHRYRRALVIAEVALSLVLLAGAGLMVESVARLLRVNPGYDADNLLSVHPGLLRKENYYRDLGRSSNALTALYTQLHEKFAALPGVKAVGISKINFFQLGYTIEGRQDPIGLLPAGTGVGDADLFRAMRIPLLAGRYFETSDIGKSVGTVIINETMARLCWPGENPLRKEFRGKGGVTYEVIGVVKDIRTDRYDQPVEPTFYRPFHEYAATGGHGPFFVVRTERDPDTLIPILRDTLKSVETSMTTPWFEVVRQKLYDATRAQRMYMLYLLIFAGVGLFLAALGIYGVLTYSVTRRTREIGIRMAVGAERRHVLGMIISEGARLIVAGVVIGLIAAFWLTRLLRSQLYEVTPTDPTVFASVVVFLCAVALLACWIPAWRASRVDPMQALRYE